MEFLSTGHRSLPDDARSASASETLRLLFFFEDDGLPLSLPDGPPLRSKTLAVLALSPSDSSSSSEAECDGTGTTNGYG